MRKWKMLLSSPVNLNNYDGGGGDHDDDDGDDDGDNGDEDNVDDKRGFI